MTFSHAWINQNGYLKLNYPQEVLENISFILRPTVSSGTIIKFNDDQSIDLKYSNIIIDGIKYNNSNITLNDYNSIEIKLGKTKELKINGLPYDISKKPDITIKQLQLGKENGEYDGGIRDIMINNK